MSVNVLLRIAEALSVLVLWEPLGLRELTYRGIKRLQRRKVWQKFFDLSGNVAISHSLTDEDVHKRSARVADVDVERRIRERLPSNAHIPADPPPLNPATPRDHHVVIGSTRYNRDASALQRHFECPFEYVFDHVQADPPRRILKIKSAYGQEYVASVDSGEQDLGGVDYGLLLVATLPDNRRAYWISGIHGTGTIGVAKRLLEHPEDFLREIPTGPTWAIQWLMRVKYDPKRPEGFEAILQVDILGSGMPCQVRPPSRVRAVVSDFGNVLMAFDRDRTYRALAHLLQRRYLEVAEVIEKSGETARYERGEISDDEFLARLQNLLKTDSIDAVSFAEWWGDIFWENRSVIEMFRTLKKTGVAKLILLSNTNNLHFQSVKEHYPDVLGLFDHHVLSFIEKIAKPERDIFLRALAAVGHDAKPEECVYIDDIVKNVDAAASIGMKTILFQDYPHLVRQLRRQHVYVD